MKTPLQYVQSGEHLPQPLRDFHDQKDLFKLIHRTYGHQVESDPVHPLKDMTWVAAHCFAIDWFLWFMAQRGWTLQRSRASVEFRSLRADIEAMKEQDADAFRKMLSERKPAPEPAAVKESEVQS